MVPIPALNEGGLKDIMNGAKIPDPIFQILGCKKINSNTQQKERYRLLLSDGKYSITYAMLTTASNSGTISEYSVVKLNKYLTNVIKGNDKTSETQILLIMEMDVLVNGSEVGKKIGEPVSLIEDSKRTPSSAPTPTTNQSGNSNVSSAFSEITSFSSGKSNPEPQTSLNGTFSGRKVVNPISSISPYHNKWVIKARVTNKSDIRTWSNSRGEGKLFSCDLIDESGEIRLTGFRDHVDKFYNFIQIDKVYYISKCQVKPANTQYNRLQNGYEMSMTSETIIEECEDDDGVVPTVKFDFVSLQEAGTKTAGELVDTIGICKDVSDLDIFTAKKTNREMKKRTVNLVDQSNTSMTLTLWGAQAESFDGSNNPVIAIKGAKVSEFGGGKFLSTLMSSQMKINPDIPECHRIKGWFDSEGKTTQMKNVSERTGGPSVDSNWMCFKDVLDKGLGKGDRGEYYKVFATILLVRTENAVYKACPSADCNKKLIDHENGMYRCEKCSQEYPNFKYRLLVSMNLGDWSGNQWVTLFSSEAEKIFEKSSKDIGEAIENNSDEGNAFLQAVNFKEFAFTCRAKTETYNDEQRLKTIVVKVEPINYAERNSYLVKTMEQNFGFAT